MTNAERDDRINKMDKFLARLDERIKVMYRMLYALLIFAVLGGISSMWRTYEYVQDKKLNRDCENYANLERGKIDE